MIEMIGFLTTTFTRLFDFFFNMDFGVGIKFGYILIGTMLLKYGKDLINILASFKGEKNDR